MFFTRINGGAIVFENETRLEFSRQFLSISISTNKAVYDGNQDIRWVQCWGKSITLPINLIYQSGEHLGFHCVILFGETNLTNVCWSGTNSPSQLTDL